ncbi:Pas42 [Actinoplanes phage phiAsp2]|uniref:Pas42 n=1 Tax=Actinoplanes phage phiAsp2 TaxID=279303 RepID=Q6J7Y9_9CAUD|nr:Pas42 [Actinoplanes phage phiAsp2]AAT36790.1 Pas42 [Actinoplanes phage phiAsp2]
MAQNLTHTEARNYPLSNGETADLIALVSSVKPQSWVQATEAQPIGTVVYAYAMGELRRGVVVKNTPTKTLVALTTAAAAAPGGTVRVQTATELHTTVYVAPAPVVETPAEPAQEAEEGAERFTLTETQIEENAAESEALEPGRGRGGPDRERGPRRDLRPARRGLAGDGPARGPRAPYGAADFPAPQRVDTSQSSR